jgi:hypothetical protein
MPSKNSILKWSLFEYMSFLKGISFRFWSTSIFFLIPSGFFLYILFLLAFNVNRGFDITDESYNILWASNPGDVIASTTQFGHYTGIIYSLANGNLAVFRLLGLFLLLLAAGFFSHSLERYWRHSLKISTSDYSRWLSLSVILAGTMVYYRSWLLTPSYNWLALVSVLIVATGLLHAAVNAGERGANLYDNLSLFGYGLLVGIGGGLSFMAKPTTAAILAIIFIYFIGITSLRRRWKAFAAVSIISSTIFILSHAFIFENGMSLFYAELRDGLELSKLLGGGHTIRDISLRACGDLKQIPGRLVQDAGLAFLALFFAVGFNRYKKFRKKEITNIFIILLAIVSALSWFQLWEEGYWVGGTSIGQRIGFGGLAFSIVLLFSSISTAMLWKKDKPECNNSNKMQFRRLLGLYLFLILLAMAYAFGSGNGLIRQMSGAFVFFSAASLYSALWVDQKVEKKYLGNSVALLLVISVYLVLTFAYKNPYRLPADLKDQVVKVTFTGNKKAIFVDEETAKYVNALKKTALGAGWKAGMYLIDLTGGSPGTTIILGGRAPGVPWLLGSYKGSNDFAETILKMVPKSVLREAWLLIAPDGKRSLAVKILNNIGLDYPREYVEVGKAKTGHRNELHFLFKPMQ